MNQIVLVRFIIIRLPSYVWPATRSSSWSINWEDWFCWKAIPSISRSCVMQTVDVLLISCFYSTYNPSCLPFSSSGLFNSSQHDFQYIKDMTSLPKRIRPSSVFLPLSTPKFGSSHIPMKNLLICALIYVYGSYIKLCVCSRLGGGSVSTWCFPNVHLCQSIQASYQKRDDVPGVCAGCYCLIIKSLFHLFINIIAERDTQMQRNHAASAHFSFSNFIIDQLWR